MRNTMPIRKNVDQKIQHVAVIPDGNRRWARARGLPPQAGHTEGFLKTTPKLLKTAWAQHKLHTLTLWLFSTENWGRPADEVQHLMKVYEEFLRMICPMAQEFSVKMKHLGRKDRIPATLLSAVEEVEQATITSTNHIFNFALDYGGRDEIVRAVNHLRQTSPETGLIDERLLDSFMQAAQQPYPNPDLIIRTSGERRVSGFMLWQSNYSEFYFVEKLYPDFDWHDLQAAITAFHTRKRRFGK